MRFTPLFAALYASAASASPFMHIGIPVSSVKSDVSSATSTVVSVPSSTSLGVTQPVGSGAARYIPGTNLPWPHPRIPIHHDDLFQSVNIQGMGTAVPSVSAPADTNVALAAASPISSKVVRSDDILSLPDVSIQTTDSLSLPEVTAQTLETSFVPDMSIQITDPVPDASVQTLDSSAFASQGM